MDVGEVISEMNGIGIKGFRTTAETAAKAFDVIKKESKSEKTPRKGFSFLAENQEQARVLFERMSAIADRMSKVSVGLREQLREADDLLQEMDGAAAELRRMLNE